MNRFEAYPESFPDVRLTRSKTGVLEVALQPLRRIVDEGIGYGLALEDISAPEVARRTTP